MAETFDAEERAYYKRIELEEEALEAGFNDVEEYLESLEPDPDMEYELKHDK